MTSRRQNAPLTEKLERFIVDAGTNLPSSYEELRQIIVDEHHYVDTLARIAMSYPSESDGHSVTYTRPLYSERGRKKGAVMLKANFSRHVAVDLVTITKPPILKGRVNTHLHLLQDKDVVGYAKYGGQVISPLKVSPEFLALAFSSEVERISEEGVLERSLRVHAQQKLEAPFEEIVYFNDRILSASSALLDTLVSAQNEVA